MNQKFEGAATAAVTISCLVLMGWCVGRAQQPAAQITVESAPAVHTKVFRTQEVPLLPKMPLPPDLLNVEHPNCNLTEYSVAESVDAKTGEVTQITRWRVEPYATYRDHRPKWELPSEPLPTNFTLKRPGAIADVATDFEALNICRLWRETVKRAIAELAKKQQKQQADPERRKDLGVPTSYLN